MSPVFSRLSMQARQMMVEATLLLFRDWQLQVYICRVSLFAKVSPEASHNWQFK